VAPVTFISEVPGSNADTGSSFFFLVSLGGVRLSPLGTSATVGLLYQPRMIDDDYGAVGWMRIGRGNRSTRRKPAPMPLCPPQIPHDLSWDRTRPAAEGSQRLTAWALARPGTGSNTSPIVTVIFVGFILNCRRMVRHLGIGLGRSLFKFALRNQCLMLCHPRLCSIGCTSFSRTREWPSHLVLSKYRC
jgi:hypothetical protein